MEQGGKNGKNTISVLFLLWLFATALNLTKPYHIDDVAHLLIAEWIQMDPLHPLSGILSWGNVPEPIFITNQPHLFFFMMAGVMSLFGSSELVMHLFLSVFTFAAIWWTHALARRFIPDLATFVTAAFVLSPGFLINQNVMVDVPLLAAMSGAIYYLTRPVPDGADGLRGFGLFTAALLTKYTALFLFPALIWAALISRRVVVWAALPILGLLLWSAFNYYDYGAIHILNRPPNGRGLVPSPKLTFGLLTAFGAFATPVAALLIFGHRWRLFWATVWVISAVGFVLIGQLFWADLPINYVALNALLIAACGVVGLSVGMRSAELLWGLVTAPKNWREYYMENRAELTLLAWLLGGMVFLVTFPPFMATRHAMLLVPPLFILALTGKQVALPKVPSTVVLACWTAVALVIFANDRQFALFYKETAVPMAAQAQGLANPGANVFTRGHWGWQWYIRPTGMIEYTGDPNQIRSGDLVVDPVGISAIPFADPDAYEVLSTLQETGSVATWLDTHTWYAQDISVMPLLRPNAGRHIDILRKK